MLQSDCARNEVERVDSNGPGVNAASEYSGVSRLVRQSPHAYLADINLVSHHPTVVAVSALIRICGVADRLEHGTIYDRTSATNSFSGLLDHGAL